MSIARRVSILACIATIFFTAACARWLDTVATATGDGGLGDGSGSPVTADSSGNPLTGDAAAFCSGKGPTVTLGQGSTTWTTCGGAVASTIFVNALCTCRDVHAQGYLLTRGFDSSKGAYDPKTPLGGAGVGINNAYTISAGYTDVGGSLTVAGPQSLNMAGFLQVRGDLFLKGETLVAGYTAVARDAWLAGNFTNLGPFTVKRDLHHQGNVIATPPLVSGTNTQESVAFNPPCPCDPAAILDVGKIVADAKANNDNAASNIVPGLLNNVIGSAEVTLPCGRYYLERIGAMGSVVVNVIGRAGVYIDGDLDVKGSLVFRLGPGAEVDIFIKGDLLLAGFAKFGQKERPASARIYVAGSKDVTLTGVAGFVGNLYAPHAIVSVIGFAPVYGSIFALDFVNPGNTSIVYDWSIVNLTCPQGPTPPPPGSCQKCGTCTGGTACINGTCAACKKDADCCSPLVCISGKCQQNIDIE